MNSINMTILATEYKQREYDGKWEYLAKVLDEENSYSYRTEEGSLITLIPTRWLTLGVYDYEFVFEEE